MARALILLALVATLALGAGCSGEESGPVRFLVFGDPEEPRHREALAIVAQTEETIAAVLRRDERVGEGDAATLARIVSAVMFLSMAVSVNIALSIEEIVQDIRGQVVALLPL